MSLDQKKDPDVWKRQGLELITEGIARWKPDLNILAPLGIPIKN